MLIDELDLKKKYLWFAVILGFASYIPFPNPNFEFSFVFEGFFIGLGIGFVWTFFNYKKNSLEGIKKTRKDFTSFIIFIGAYLTGYAVPYFIHKAFVFFSAF